MVDDSFLNASNVSQVNQNHLQLHMGYSDTNDPGTSKNEGVLTLNSGLSLMSQQENRKKFVVGFKTNSDKKRRYLSTP